MIRMHFFSLAIIGALLLTACNQSQSSGESIVAKADWNDLKQTEIHIPEGASGEAELTRNFYFILDGSGSMGEEPGRHCGGDQQFSDKMAGARWAIKTFLEKVPDSVNIGLMVFDDHGSREVLPLGRDNRESFVQAVESMRTGGGTPLATAIESATDKLVSQYQTQLGYGEFRLVVVTDGIADHISRAAYYAARHGMPIYTIGLCVKPNHPLRTFSVSYRAADNFSDLAKGLEDTLAELPNYDQTTFQ